MSQTGSKSKSLSLVIFGPLFFIWMVSKLRKRLSEHKSSAVITKSAVREHVVRSGGHDIDWTGVKVKVLERESKEFSRRVLEDIQIKTKGPNLNRDKACT